MARCFLSDLGGRDLWDVYIGAFPGPARQYHNCSACRDGEPAAAGLQFHPSARASFWVLFAADGAEQEYEVRFEDLGED